MKAILIAISRIFLKAAVDRALMEALPKIYEKLDTRIPTALFNRASPVIVKSEIEYTIGQITRKPVTEDMVALVVALYDPIQNAKRIQRHPR
jgi:hypothetical protein